jgi:hypothetical protein
VTADPVERVHGDRGGQGGFVLTWVALMLVVLIVFAGVAVDVGNWYFVGNKAQKAADAGALAGAVFLPSDPGNGFSVARNTVEANGFSSTLGDTVAAVQASRPNQMRVTVTRSVGNYFLGLIGINKTTITRTAVGEFQGPIPMGSPDNHVGIDPETGADPDYWINVAAPNATKREGDRYSAKLCDDTVAGCSTAKSPPNTEYSQDGYSFAVRVNAISAGKPLVFQVFDPEYAYVGDHCSNVTFPTAAQLKALASQAPTGSPPAGFYSDAAARYVGTDAGHAANWCTADMNVGAPGSPELTTFIVRKPDATPFNDFDNPVISTGTCRPVQVPGYDLSTGPTLLQRLTPGDGVPIGDPDSVYDPSNNWRAGGLTFTETFRRWVSVCKLPAGSSDITTGDYILQIRSNAAPGAPLAYDPTVATIGHNRLALRVGFQNGSGTLSGASINIFGNGKLPIYANAADTGSATTTFYLARLLPSGGDRVLQVPLYDMGDASVAGTLELLGPDGRNWTGCTFKRDFSTDVVSSNCQLTGVSAGAGYNGRIVTIVAPVPSSYTCDPTDPDDCWFKIRASFAGGVYDTTTWQAFVQGDPVHLIE